MELVMRFVDNLTTADAFNIFLCDGIHYYFSSECEQLLRRPLIRSVARNLEITGAVLGCYAEPETSRWAALVDYTLVEAYRVNVSNANCLATQQALMTALSGRRMFEWKNVEQKHDGSVLVATLEKTGCTLTETSFAVYALGIHPSGPYGGHALLLMQYRAGGRLTYRLLQSYMNHYSLPEFLHTEAARPMDHGALLERLEKLTRFTKRGRWDAEKDRLHSDLFGVSLPKNMDAELAHDMVLSFHYSENSVEKFCVWQTQLQAVSHGARFFVQEQCIEDEAYAEQLVGQFEPLIMQVHFIT